MVADCYVSMFNMSRGDCIGRVRNEVVHSLGRLLDGELIREGFGSEFQAPDALSDGCDDCDDCDDSEREREFYFNASVARTGHKAVTSVRG